MARECFEALKKRILQQCEQYYLQNYMGLSLSPAELASVLDRLEQLQEMEAGEEEADPKIRIGASVRLLDLQDNSEIHLRLVEPRDSNPSGGDISVLSPLGAALLGMMPADHVEVRFLGKQIRFLVLQVSAAGKRFSTGSPQVDPRV